MHTKPKALPPSRVSRCNGPNILMTTALLAALAAPSKAGDILFTVEEPQPDSIYSGVQNLRGWAVSSAGIDRIELHVDGQYITDIPSGGLRRDVGDQYPGYPDADRSGFSMAYSYANLSPGRHEIRIRVVDADGDTQERRIAFDTARFEGGFIQDPESVDATGAQVSATDKSIRISGLMVQGVPHDVTLEWNPGSQNLAFSQITATGGNDGDSGGSGGGDGQCVTLPFPAEGTTIEWSVSGNTESGALEGTIVTQYLSVSNTKTVTDTLSTLSGSGVTTTTRTTTTQYYYITDEMLYVEKIVVTGSAETAGYSVPIDSTLVNDPPILRGPAHEYCLGQTWTSPSVSQTITSQGTTTTGDTPGSTGRVEAIGESVTTPAGTFTTVRMKTLYNNGGEETNWLAIDNGLLVRQEITGTDGYTQSSIATQIR